MIEKYSKAQVHYERPAKGRDHCALCRYFHVAAQSCSLVEGLILPGDWCDKFEKVRPGTGKTVEELLKR